MKQGYLSGYFTGIAAKRLSEVETNPSLSNQHEFNGVRKLQEILGQEKARFQAKFLYLTDQDDYLPVADEGFLTWYDSRENHPTRSEYRLYYSDNQALQCASAQDLLLIARCRDNTLLVIVAEQGTTTERQLLWLFGLSDASLKSFAINADIEDISEESSFSARLILEQIGLTPEDDENEYLERAIIKYPDGFPPTREFSAYARSTLPHIKSNDDPDAALMLWMEREEALFYALEKHLLTKSLRAMLARGKEEPDGYIKLVQSTLQRRKSRAGYAMENHLEQIFIDHKIHYARGAKTEGRSKPDFIFPGQAEYHNPAFPGEKLLMLGVKTTCKDRWRQILTEAARIPRKHLATLEPAISTHQTDEMSRAGVQLVIPKSLHESFSAAQQGHLLSVRDFTGLMMLAQNR